MNKNIIYIIMMWSLLAFVGYNVLTIEATTEDKKSEIKKICKGFDSGKWNDDSNKCKFSKEGIKIEDDAEFDHVLSDEGLYDNYIQIQKDRKNSEREWYYNENTNQHEYLSDKEIKEHNMESESGIMQGENWGPETPIEPPSEPYPTTEEEIKDWKNTVSDDGISQQEYFEARAESNQDGGNIHELVEKIVEEEENEQNEETDSQNEEEPEQEQEESDDNDNDNENDSEDSDDSNEEDSE